MKRNDNLILNNFHEYELFSFDIKKLKLNVDTSEKTFFVFIQKNREKQ